MLCIRIPDEGDAHIFIHTHTHTHLTSEFTKIPQLEKMPACVYLVSNNIYCIVGNVCGKLNFGVGVLGKVCIHDNFLPWV